MFHPSNGLLAERQQHELKDSCPEIVRPLSLYVPWTWCRCWPENQRCDSRSAVGAEVADWAYDDVDVPRCVFERGQHRAVHGEGAVPADHGVQHQGCRSSSGAAAQHPWFTGNLVKWTAAPGPALAKVMA